MLHGASRGCAAWLMLWAHVNHIHSHIHITSMSISTLPYAYQSLDASLYIYVHTYARLHIDICIWHLSINPYVIWDTHTNYDCVQLPVSWFEESRSISYLVWASLLSICCIVWASLIAGASLSFSCRSLPEGGAGAGYSIVSCSIV